MSQNDSQKPQSTLIPEPTEDSFEKYDKDPRLDKSVLKTKTPKTSTDQNYFVQKIAKLSDSEEVFKELREYKIEQHEEIINTLENEPLKNRQIILSRLSDVADNIIKAAYAHVRREMEKKYGLPYFLNAYKQELPAHLALVGMGKLGSKKLNYYSDLDLIFIYSHRGETKGDKSIDNAEYFVKLVQRLINAISLMTAHGRCYEIDTELRPSGNTGMLVTSYDHFIDHQMNQAQNWERQALLRARPMTDNPEYQELLEDQIQKLLYKRPLPPDFTKTMGLIREQVIKERVKETDHKIDIKLGRGGIMDIEFILHNIQLKNGQIHPDLRQRSLFDLLDALKNHDFLNKPDLALITQAHLVYRTIESELHLIKKRAESMFDFESDVFSEIAERLDFPNLRELQKEVVRMRTGITKIYNRIYG